MRKNLQIYIHIPFCKSKCRYCSFCSLVGVKDMYLDYVKALKKEIFEVSKSNSCKEKNIVQSIYFGGGTPSLLPEKYIEEILKVVFDNFYLDKNIEITLEANPDTVNEEILKNYKNIEINRLSFGVQSFLEKDMEFLNRNINEKNLVQIITTAEKYFDDLSLDLIFGLAEQTHKDWQYNLKKACEFNISHLSCYELMLEKNSMLFYQKHKYKFPDENEILKMYEFNESYLGKQGFSHYEISNWHKQKHCIYNYSFWKGSDYLGFGLSAESIFENKSIVQTKNIKTYIENSINSRKQTKLSDFDNAILYIQNHFRLLEEGINIKKFNMLFPSYKENFTKFLNTYKDKFIFKNNNIILTKNSFLIIESIIEEISNNFHIPNRF